MSTLFESARAACSPDALPHEGDRHLHQVLDALPAAIYTTDAEGRITYFNQAAVELSGRRPELGTDAWCVSWRLYRPDGTPLPHDQCPMAVALREGRPVRGVWVVAERPDGTRVSIMPYPTPLRDASGVVTGAVNMLVDITESRRRERDLQQFASIVESSDDAIISKSPEGIITTWNRGAERLFGYTADEIVGQSIMVLIPPDRHDEEPAILKRVMRGERIDHYETIRQRKDGSLVEISLSVSPVKDREGRIVGASKIARNITDRKRVEEQQNLLLREMGHRVKNLFAVASGLVTLSARSAGTPEDMAMAVRERMRALARAHDLIRPGLTEAGDHVAENPNLHALVQTIFTPYLDAKDVGDRERVMVAGPDVPIGGNTVSGLALILHEFTTNAAKYGALSAPAGHVRIDWSIENGELVLTWKEQGGPSVDKAPSESGFGSLLARRTVTGQFGGRLSYDWKAGGLVIHMAIPMERLTT